MTISQSVPVVALERGFGLASSLREVSPSEGKGEEVGGVPAGSTNAQLCNFPTRRQTDPDEPYNPHATTAAAYHVARVWAWVEGAWGYYKPGEIADWMPASKKPEGRLFFCGEHTSPWSGWMQGAFESALRVVAQITG
jgi:hypothetical protein